MIELEWCEVYSRGNTGDEDTWIQGDDTINLKERFIKIVPFNQTGLRMKQQRLTVHHIQQSGEAKAQSVDVLSVKNTLHVSLFCPLRESINSLTRFVPFQVKVQLSCHSKFA